jgi:hypothetical protein
MQNRRGGPRHAPQLIRLILLKLKEKEDESRCAAPFVVLDGEVEIAK